MVPKNIKKVISITTDVNYFPLNKKYAVFRCTTQFALRSEVSEGIATLKNIKLHEPGTPIDTDEKICPLLATKDMLEFFRTVGWDGSDSIYEKIRELLKEPYTNFVNGLVLAEDLIFIDHSCHMIFDSNKSPLSVALYMDYTNILIDNSRYDLELALKILSKRSDIKFLNSRNEPDENPAILDIPYHSADRIRSAYLRFVWMPDKETYLKMWNQVSSHRASHLSSYEKCKAIFDADLLGLRSGGAAKYKDYHERDEEKEVDDEDDEEYYSRNRYYYEDKYTGEDMQG